MSLSRVAPLVLRMTRILVGISLASHGALYLAAVGPGAWAVDNLRARAASDEAPKQPRDAQPGLRAA